MEAGRAGSSGLAGIRSLLLSLSSVRAEYAGVSLTGPFNGERAFTDLKELVAFGPQPSGSQAIERCRAFIVGELRRANVSVTEDSFAAITPIGPIPMTNVVATIPGDSPSM